MNKLTAEELKTENLAVKLGLYEMYQKKTIKVFSRLHMFT